MINGQASLSPTKVPGLPQLEKSHSKGYLSRPNVFVFSRNGDGLTPSLVSRRGCEMKSTNEKFIISKKSLIQTQLNW